MAEENTNIKLDGFLIKCKEIRVIRNGSGGIYFYPTVCLDDIDVANAIGEWRTGWETHDAAFSLNGFYADAEECVLIDKEKKWFGGESISLLSYMYNGHNSDLIFTMFNAPEKVALVDFDTYSSEIFSMIDNGVDDCQLADKDIPF